jgi:SAM-dependent methyltransferase
MSDHRLYAAVYDRMCAPAEAAGLAQRRRSLLAGAEGRVLEVGGGTGRNLAYYPSELTSLVVLEPDGAMRRRLMERAGACAFPVEVLAAGIDDAQLADGSFDTVVCTLVLCTVPDIDAAAVRIRALLAPGGKVLFLEHSLVAGARGFAQRLATPVWKRIIPGCHLDRDPTSALRRAGLLVRTADRFRVPLAPALASWGVQGVAAESLRAGSPAPASDIEGDR